MLLSIALFFGISKLSAKPQSDPDIRAVMDV
jgi:hypothetical protein